MQQITKNKIRPLLESHMAEAQSAFRPGRIGHDHMFTIEQLTGEKTTQSNTRVI